MARVSAGNKPKNLYTTWSETRVFTSTFIDDMKIEKMKRLQDIEE
jgi:hypothetical protein